MKNFNWEKYSKPVILAAFIVIRSAFSRLGKTPAAG